MRPTEPADVTSVTSSTRHIVGYVAPALQLVACFIPVVELPDGTTRTWIDCGALGYVIAALAVYSLWTTRRTRNLAPAWCGALSAMIAWGAYVGIILDHPIAGLHIPPGEWEIPDIGLFLTMAASIVTTALPFVATRRDP